MIENACKYSAPEAPIELALLPSEAELSIEVRDQGIGVPPEDQERIFERFQRASNAPAGEGSGLGLSVVRLLVEGMGGQVSLRSQLGKGSVFSLHLRPVEPAEGLMLAYLIAVSLLIPANLWAAITPHLHSEVSMRILHGLSTLALLPLLWQLWVRRKQDLLLFSLVLAVFFAGDGGGERLDHLYGDGRAFWLAGPHLFGRRLQR